MAGLNAMGQHRRKGVAIGVALSLLVSVGLVASEHQAEAASGADLVAACAPLAALPNVGPLACKSVQTGTWLAAQACRRVDALKDPLCATIDGRRVSEAAMAAFEASWLARALELQAQLDRNVPLSQALIPHTHNSANSGAYAPSVSNLDANQVLTITDQLRLGMRAIEIDLHWVPNPSGDPANGFRAVVQCHGEPVATPAGTIHVGCSIDTPLIDLLRELRTWLDSNPDQFVLLYLENVLDGDPTAHAEAVAAINEALGTRVARPSDVPDGTCRSLPVTRTKQEILDSGAQVLVTGNCGPGGWNDWVFDRYPSWDESGGSDFDCAEERGQIDFATTLVRRYEDSTWLSAMTGAGSHRDASTIAEMVRCGVNLVGFDQLYPGDDRLPALVWSWATSEPSIDASGQCAAQGADGRFFADDCETARPVACRAADGAWTLSNPVAWAGAVSACPAPAQFSVPFNGWDNDQLRLAAATARVSEVWLAYSQNDGGAWVLSP